MIALISGGPGSGKTYAVAKTLDFVDTKSVRMAPTAFVASNIRGETIHSTLNLEWGPGSTLHKITSTLENEKDTQKCLKTSRALIHEIRHDPVKNVVVLDEVGMVPFWLTYWIVRYFFQFDRNVLFVAMGDKRQLKPVRSPFNVFDVDFENEFELHSLEFKENKRFSPDYLPVVEELSKYVDRKNVCGLLDYVGKHYPVVEHVDIDLLNRCQKALVYKNFTVQLYNAFYTSRLPGKAYRLYKIENKKIDTANYVDIKPGCDVVITENNATDEKDIVNGSELTFREYDASKDAAVCFDKRGKKILVRRTKGSFPLTPNFARTIHKFQGSTIDSDRVVFNFNGSDDIHLMYTALSRVRSMNQILAVVL